MPNKDIFCNSPWYELHIYWDGGYGFCCQEYYRMYPDHQKSKFNIRNMSISEWYNSDPMKNARIAMHSETKNSFCKICYHDEIANADSRRHKSNLKSVIFTKSNFSESYLQSPGFDKFEAAKHTGNYNGLPIDLHVNFGNHCNLACKMCTREASSKIAAQEVKWGIKDSSLYIGTDWTKDESAWQRFLSEIKLLNIHTIHFMGGETLISKRFSEFLDYMISIGRTQIGISFVTNGTIFNSELIEKLLKFSRVSIEISIESLTQANEYQRQGTINSVVLSNIEKYSHLLSSNISIVLRPAISALTVGSYHTLLEYAFKNNLIIKSLPVVYPEFLSVSVLPESIRKEYKQAYLQLLKKLKLEDIDSLIDINNSNLSNLPVIIKDQIVKVISLLDLSFDPLKQDALLKQLVEHCTKWDKVYNYNAIEVYPELASIFKQYGY